MVTQPVSHAVHGHHAPHGPTTCLNCQHEYEGNFCNECGQRADTHRVNWHYLWHDALHSVWHYDRGMLFTLRELFTRPGHSIREFLEGKRINHYRPLALLLILGAILLFVTHGLGVSFAQKSQEVFGNPTANASERIKTFQMQMNQFVENNQNLIHIAMIPLYAFWFWFMFRRKGYNYPEILVAQTFISNVQALVSLLIVVLFWAMGASNTAFAVAMSLSMLAYIVYNTITYTQLFAGKMRPRVAVLRSVVAYVLAYINFLLIVVLIGGGYGIYIGYQEGKAKATKAAVTTSPAPKAPTARTP